MLLPKFVERRLYFRKPFPWLPLESTAKKLSYIATSMKEKVGDFGMESFRVKVLSWWISVKIYL